MAKATKTKSHTKAISPADTPGPESAGSRFVRYCVVFLMLGVMALVWLSLLTYSPTDWPPSSHILPMPGYHNAAGAAGAHLAHWLLYWLGSGVYVGAFFLTIIAIVLLIHGRMRDLPWRIAGFALLTTAFSVARYLRYTPTESAGREVGPAGVFGEGLGGWLFANFDITGTWLIVSISIVLGLLLAADFIVLRIPKAAQRLAAWFAKRSQDRRESLAAAVEATKSKQTGLYAPTSQPGERGGAPKPISPPEAAPQPTPPHEETSPKPKVTIPTPVAPASPKRKSPTPPSQPARPVSLPSLDLLAEPTTGYAESQQAAAMEKGEILQRTLDNFNVDARVVSHTTGPVITLFEVSLAPGVKVSQVGSLDTDIARSLAVPGVRVVPHLPGRDTIGIEVPNLEKEMVCIKALMGMASKKVKEMHLPLYLGKDAGGDPIIHDLARMPHMLIAGTTGSGKSVCINAIIMSLLMTRRPDEIGFILVDPKMVEMAAFEDVGHLLCPIVNDMRKAEGMLEWAATKMDERYDLLREAGVRNIADFNALGQEELYKRLGVDTEEDKARIPTKLKYFIIIIDELADLMMTSSKEVENYIIRIAQKARAVGIHLILATQRPSANVVTGLIKSNMPCRVSFRVASKQESRIVLDQNGAEVLLGQGDMLILLPGESNLLRAQGTFVMDSEIRDVTGELRREGKPQYNRELIALNSRPPGDEGGGMMDEKDPMFDKAVEAVLTAQRGSVSLLQRKLAIGYGRASRIIDQMAEAGILGDHKGSQARECMMTLEDWQQFQKAVAADQSGSSSLDGEPTSS
jgi:S-DNA-T family DNA segregation ATPase FtsK/SpoIIIE